MARKPQKSRNLRKSPKQPETGMDRLKQIALWQWGLIVICAGVISNFVLQAMGPTGSSRAAQRGEALGRGAATLFFVLVGLGLIATHFIRGRRE